MIVEVDHEGSAGLAESCDRFDLGTVLVRKQFSDVSLTFGVHNVQSCCGLLLDHRRRRRLRRIRRLLLSRSSVRSIYSRLAGIRAARKIDICRGWLRSHGLGLIGRCNRCSRRSSRRDRSGRGRCGIWSCLSWCWNLWRSRCLSWRLRERL